MSRMEFRRVDLYYGGNHVVRNVTLTVGEGEFVTLLGPSGSGKSALIRAAAGLEKPQSGVMTLDGRTLFDGEEALYAPPASRELGAALQPPALWPHMTAYQNASFGLTRRRLPRGEVESRTLAALKLLRVGACRNRYPAELSGEQRQRTAIARALAASPRCLLLDEPLSGVEPERRFDLCGELRGLHRALGAAVLCATKDRMTAMSLSTRIAFFRAGEIVQQGTPAEVFRNPIDLDAAAFLCASRLNLIEGEAELWQGDLAVRSPVGNFTFPRQQVTEELIPRDQWFDCVLAVRPEEISLSPWKAETGIRVRVASLQSDGSETLLSLRGEGTELLARHLGPPLFSQDQQLFAVLAPARINVYNRDTTRLIKRAV